MSGNAAVKGLYWRGYPVTLVSDGVLRLLDGRPGKALAAILATAKDTAEPDEPSGWTFEADVNGTTVCIERFGGIRETDRHEGGQWSVFLPGER